MTNTKIIEVEIEKIIGIDNEERDPSVGYYQPFCIVCENDNKQQVQLFLNYDNLIDLAQKLKPYLDDLDAQIKLDKEMYEDWRKENEKEKLK